MTIERGGTLMNTLMGTIVDIHSSDMISMINVDVDGDIFSSIILEGKKGPFHYKLAEKAHLLFKETEVGIAKNLSGLISFRNRFPARIKKVETGPVLSKIILDYRGKWIESIISTRSVGDMGLKEDDHVEWLVKTNEVSLMPIPQ
ncbi:MAG TPA: hypothetical protein DD723_01165 [Candidatus Omnitrophica bacterium]|nr:hypothetical protein [Candidatus Omnitrophota bacterium]